MGKRRNLEKHSILDVDFLLLVLVLIATVWGIIAVYSASYSLPTAKKFIGVQIFAAACGFAAMFLICIIDYKIYKKLFWLILVFDIFILVLVLLIGSGDKEGSKSWIRFAGIGIQPAEIAKVGFIITFSYHLSRVKDSINAPKTMLMLLLHLCSVIVLIMLQPDAGTTMSFIFIFAVLLFVAGISYKYILAAGGLFAVFVPVSWIFLLKGYQKERILTFIDPERDPAVYGYQAIQSKIAIGSGEIFGKGYLDGTQTQLGYLPAKQTDFIFSTIAEEMGFIFSVLLILLLVAIILRCIYIAFNAKDDFGKFISMGVGAMLIFHVFENVGMCIGLTPITGIPLPFFSYGGSSIVANMLAMGLVLAVRYRSSIYENNLMLKRTSKR